MPTFAEPFAIVDTIMAEKKAVMPRQLYANILKSPTDMLPAEKEIGMLDMAACADEISTLELTVAMILISCDESANKKGAIKMLVAVIKII